jgi:hypothetical protein
MANYTAYVMSDLYNFGITEDGTPFIGEMYYVQIEDTDGRRFCHDSSFSGVEVSVCDYSGETYFIDRREQAIAKAERLATRVNAALKAGRGVDFDCWSEVDPAYGSDAYISSGTEQRRVYQEMLEG